MTTNENISMFYYTPCFYHYLLCFSSTVLEERYIFNYLTARSVNLFRLKDAIFVKLATK